MPGMHYHKLPCIPIYIQTIILYSPHCYSAAKVTSRSKVLDYIIDLELTVIDTTGVKSAIKVGPIVIPSVQFHSPDSLFKGMDAKYRSNVLQFPANGVLTDVGITIIETNPLKVRAQKILSLWKANQTDIRRIVDLIIKE